MKKLLIISAVFLLMSCGKEAESVSFKGLGNFKVEFLFENEGCKMYRFEDGGRYIYYSDCRGAIEYQYRTSTNGGKSSIRYEQQTLNN